MPAGGYTGQGRCRYSFRAAMRRRDEPSPSRDPGRDPARVAGDAPVAVAARRPRDRPVVDAPPLPTNDGWMQVALVDDPEEAEAPSTEAEAPRDRPPGKLIKQDRVRKEAVPDETEARRRVRPEGRQGVAAAQGRAKPARPRASPAPPRTPTTCRRRRTCSTRARHAARREARGRGEADEGPGDPALPKVPSPRSLLPLRPELAPAGRPGLRGNPAEMSPARRASTARWTTSRTSRRATSTC
jgi:hypothetical protein